jgi:hypothetical protein
MSSRKSPKQRHVKAGALAVISKSEMRGCIGKVRHESERQAKRSIEKRCAHAEVQLYTYKCKHCKGWHLTHRARGISVGGRPNADGFEYVESV